MKKETYTSKGFTYEAFKGQAIILWDDRYGCSDLGHPGQRRTLYELIIHLFRWEEDMNEQYGGGVKETEATLSLAQCKQDLQEALQNLNNVVNQPCNNAREYLDRVTELQADFLTCSVRFEQYLKDAPFLDTRDELVNTLASYSGNYTFDPVTVCHAIFDYVSGLRRRHFRSCYLPWDETGDHLLDQFTERCLGASFVDEPFVLDNLHDEMADPRARVYGVLFDYVRLLLSERVIQKEADERRIPCYASADIKAYGDDEEDDIPF